MSLELCSAHGISDFRYRSRHWLDVAVYCVSQNLSPGKCWQSLAAEQATVAVVLQQGSGFCEPRKRINVPLARSRYDAGHSMYIPPHAEIWGWAASQDLVRDLRARFKLAAIEEMLGDDFDRHKWIEPVLLVYDERVRTIAELIWAECHSDLDMSPLYGESLTTALMAGFFTRVGANHSPKHAGLSRLKLKRTLEYMEANLVREIHLDEVARVAGLSCSHFGRAFKASMGASPHRWLMQRRIERAQQLLAKKETIASTAQIVGFATRVTSAGRSEPSPAQLRGSGCETRRCVSEDAAAYFTPRL